MSQVQEMKCAPASEASAGIYWMSREEGNLYLYQMLQQQAISGVPFRNEAAWGLCLLSGHNIAHFMIITCL